MRERVYVKRKHDKKSWKKIAGEVRKRKGKHPYWEVVRAAFKVLSTDKNQEGKGNYSNCGCKEILTPTFVKWLIQKMKELPIDADCSSKRPSAAACSSDHRVPTHWPKIHHGRFKGRGMTPRFKKQLPLALAH